VWVASNNKESPPRDRNLKRLLKKEATSYYGNVATAATTQTKPSAAHRYICGATFGLKINVSVRDKLGGSWVCG
jgi:hypothetical protein